MPTHPRWNARYAHDELAQMLRHQEWLLHRILERITTMSAELDRLTTEVGETRTVVDSAVLLLGQLADLIRANATDPAALNALADDLDRQQGDLAAAVAANTPTP